MNGWRTIGVCVLVIALVWSAPAACEENAETPAPASVRPRLEVPYLPQSEHLCGGAALAMVMRYWGEPDLWAVDFADLVDQERNGIPAGELVRAVEARGWAAWPLRGSPALAVEQLAGGRPLIALIGPAADAGHYVILVAWSEGTEGTEGRVVYHDPKVGPFRSMGEGAFMATWAVSDYWALLILPPVEASDVEGPVAGIREPDAAPPTGVALSLLEQAGSLFRAGDWAGAAQRAEQALALAPGDTNALQLLAGSRFLAGNLDGALHAWNRLDQPIIDLTRVDGLGHIRYNAIADQLALPHGHLLTPSAFRRAARRLAEVPAATSARLGLRPRPGGLADIEVAILERPLVGAGRWDLARAGARAAIRREVAVEVASPTGNGELWLAAWRWWAERPRLLLSLAAPAAGGRSGLWRVEGSRETQSYAFAGRNRVREERRRAAFSFADWVAADRRFEIGLALDSWVGRGTMPALSLHAEARSRDDRMVLTAEASGWRGSGHAGSFGAAGLGANWNSAGLDPGNTWLLRLGLAGATVDAPLALWAGAGTGEGRDPLLRAHPLLDGGVIDSPGFGRLLCHLTVERQFWSWHLGPLAAGWALFADAARAGETGRLDPVGWLVDGGAGLRARGPGRNGMWRLDVAHGLTDGETCVSLAWQGP